MIPAYKIHLVDALHISINIFATYTAILGGRGISRTNLQKRAMNNLPEKSWGPSRLGC